ncbi:hypothetical protein [Flavobacterium sp. ACN6]|nr:hypothetical protein [Flavobacterium sp. ACN6]
MLFWLKPYDPSKQKPPVKTGGNYYNQIIEDTASIPNGYKD